MYSKAIEMRYGPLRRECIQSLFVLLVFDTVKGAVKDVDGNTGIYHTSVSSDIQTPRSELKNEET